MRSASRLGWTVLSAVAYGACFPPRPHPWLAAVALVPLFVVLRDTSVAGALGLAWLWTTVMAYTVNDWFPRMVADYFGQPAVVGVALFLGVSTFTAAVEYMAFALAYPRLLRHGGVVTPLLVAAAWVGADLGRATLLGGDPWAFLGYTQATTLPLAQIADLTGVHGITFVLVVVNAALAELVVARARTLRTVGLATALVAATAAYGLARLSDSSDAASPATVAVVQGNLDVGAQWREDLYGANLEAYLALTKDALERWRPRLMVWPENAMTFFLDQEPSYGAVIGRTLAPSGTQLLAGGPRRGAGADVYYNAAYLVAPDGRVLAAYDKEHLLPFAEYFPGALDLLRRRFARVRAFTPGAVTPPLPTVIGPAGVLVCNEAMLPEPAAARIRAGARFLVHLANDSWLGDPKFSEPVFDMVKLRAIEQRRWIVRASTAGPSAIVDPWGRVRAETVPFTAAVAAGDVTPRDEVTIYNRCGDLFALACCVAALIGVLAPRARLSSGRTRA